MHVLHASSRRRETVRSDGGVSVVVITKFDNSQCECVLGQRRTVGVAEWVRFRSGEVTNEREEICGWPCKVAEHVGSYAESVEIDDVGTLQLPMLQT